MVCRGMKEKESKSENLEEEIMESQNGLSWKAP